MWNTPANKETVSKTIEALKKNGMTAYHVTSDEVVNKIHELIPDGSEIMTMTSVTLATLGIAKDINEGSRYTSLRKKLMTMSDETEKLEKNKIGAAPQYAVGSVHAITEGGEVFIASQTGSQLAAYVYGAQHVVWVVGTQKIVADETAALKRIYDYVLPLESERAHKAYGVAGSNVSKLLKVSQEVNPDRITIVFVDGALGF